MASTYLFVLIPLMILVSSASSFSDGPKRQENIIEAVVQLSDWFKENHGNFTTLEPHIAGLMVTSLRLAGHQPKSVLSDYHVGELTIADSLKAHLDENPSTKPLGQLAYISLGTLALCPKHLAGNLTKTFIDGLDTFQQSGAQDFNNYFQYSVVVLALCHSTEDIQDDMVNKIVSKLTEAHGHLSKSTCIMSDTTAMVIMALSCIRRKTQTKENVNEAISKYMDSLMGCLRSGNAWNIHSKSIAVQALTGLPSDLGHHEMYGHDIKKYHKKLIKDILREKDITGTFGDVLANIQVLAALTGRSLVHLGDLACPQDKEGLQTKKRKKISVCIQLAFRKKNTWRYFKRVNLTVDENTTAMEILKLAAQRNHAYEFEAEKTSFGHMITAISGVEHNPNQGTYWALYASENTMASDGVDLFTPGNNTCITFKYDSFKKMDDVNMVEN